METYVEAELRSGKLAYFYNPHKLKIEPDIMVIVEVDRGYDIATVVHSSIWNEELEIQFKNDKITKLIKVAQEEDLKQIDIVKQKEVSAGEKFLKVLGKYPFEMKLIETIYQFDGNKLTFFFTADCRIDFREFVRELATIFRTRIELHQSTGRDEAKRLSGIGVCGYKYCCSSFLKCFNQVTIKMVKDQNLSSNLSKISGPCGRLLCCLQYEEDYYEENAKDFPEIGDTVLVNDKMMYVYKNDYSKRCVHLSNDDQVVEIISLEQYDKLNSGEVDSNSETKNQSGHVENSSHDKKNHSSNHQNNKKNNSDNNKKNYRGHRGYKKR